MTRRFLSLFAGLLMAAGCLRADMANAGLVKSAILDNNVAYLRVGTVGKNLAEEIDSAQSILAAMKQISGTVPDMRFADGADAAAVEVATNFSTSRKSPLVVPNKSSKFISIGTILETNSTLATPTSHRTQAEVSRGLSGTNKIIGTILDLRFANGDDFEASQATVKLFGPTKSPLAILVNGETRGAAAKLAADLRGARAGLLFGTPANELKPDIAVAVDAGAESIYFKNPYAAMAANATNSASATNSFSPFIDHTSEADLVRAKIKDGDQDEDVMPARPAEPQKPFIHDPVLARAVDLIKALAVVRQPRS